MRPRPAGLAPAAAPPTLVRGAAALAILLVAFYGIDRLTVFLNTPQSGIYGTFHTDGYLIQTLHQVDSSEPLAAGWKIRAVDGIPVSAWFRSLVGFPPGPGPGWLPNDRRSISVADHKGNLRTVLLTLRPFSSGDLWGPFWVWFLAWLILLSGAYLIFHFPAQGRVTLLSCLLLAAALSIFNHAGRHLALELSGRLPLIIAIRLGALSFIFSSWLYLILIFISLRGELRLSAWVPWAIFFLPPFLVLGAVAFSGEEMISRYEYGLRLLYLAAGGVVAFTMAILWYFGLRTRDAVLKAQLKWILWGHLLGMTPYILLFSLPLALTGTPLIQYSTSLVPLPLIIFSYFFAFYRYRLMDVDRVIETSLVYGISTGILALGYLTILWLTKEKFLGALGFAPGLRTDLVVLFGLALVFNPLKNQVQQGIVKALFPERIALPALLLEASALISRSANLNEIAAVFLEALPARLSIDQAALMLRRPSGLDWDLRQNPKGWLRLGASSLAALEDLEKTEPLRSFWDFMALQDDPADPRTLPLLKDKGVAAVFPLRSLDDLWGFYLLGAIRSHRLLNNQEVHVVVTLATQAAHLVGNARLLEGLQRTNRSLGELNSRLLQAEQMANLGEGAAVLAHELKNPLGIIRGSAEILLKGRGPSQQTEILQFILEETDRLAALTDEFMRFARMAPPEKNPTDLDDLVQSVAFLWESRRKAPSPLTIRFELGLPGETVALDSRQVYQVLLNLLGNAEDAMPAGGQLLLATGLERSSGKAWVSVEDTGKGIPAKDLPRVFDRFFTTKESGLGLGLALVKKVAEAHGGSARIESTEGQGTRVTLFFPLVRK